MRPTLKQLQYLVAISETGKFNEAARRMNVSQPSLSAQIADMEIELDTHLVERGRHGAVMTPSGEEVVRKARLILRQVEELKMTSRENAGVLTGHIRLGVIPTVGPYLLPNATNDLHAMFPELRMSVHEERSRDLNEHLRDGRFDVVISAPEEHPNSHSLPLFTEKLWICVLPDSPFAGSSGPVNLTELKGHPLLSLGPGHHINSSIHDVAKLSGAYVSTEYEGTSLDAIRQMAAMGAGIAILPILYALTEAKRDAALVVRRIEHKNAHRTISLIWRDTSPFKNHFEQLADILRRAADSLLDEENHMAN